MEEKEKIPVGWNSKREANNTQCDSGAVERMMRRRERLFLVDGIVRRTPVPPVSSQTGTYRDRLGQTWTVRDNKGEKGTERDRQGQTGTDRDIWGQTGTGRDRQGQKGTVVAWL